MIKKFVWLNKKISTWFKESIPSFFGDKHPMTQFHEELKEIVSRRENFTILEAGGIDRPLLSKSAKYTYVGLDIEERENCYEIYDKFHVASIEEPIKDAKFDFIVSKFLLEHVEHNDKTYSSMYQELNNEGEMLHVFPCRNHPRSLLTTLVGHKIQNKLIPIIRPWVKDGVTGYKTYYSLCSKKEVENYLGDLGFSKVKVDCYWAGSDYFSFFFPAFLGMCMFNRFCELFNLTFFASGIVLYAKK